jgi:hypothetical protein
MFELVVTVGISVSSTLLFCYWFHYTCRLILSAATSQDYATNFAHAQHLCFQEVQLQLSHGATDLGGLKEMLDRDYAALTRLMHHAENAPIGIERHMLAIHYRIAAVWYKASGGASVSAARKALEEMSLVVAHFANSMGECAATSAAA